jgi:hypothetical protein
MCCILGLQPYLRIEGSMGYDEAIIQIRETYQHDEELISE